LNQNAHLWENYIAAFDVVEDRQQKTFDTLPKGGKGIGGAENGNGKGLSNRRLRTVITA